MLFKIHTIIYTIQGLFTFTRSMWKSHLLLVWVWLCVILIHECRREKNLISTLSAHWKAGMPTWRIIIPETTDLFTVLKNVRDETRDFLCRNFRNFRNFLNSIGIFLNVIVIFFIFFYFKDFVSIFNYYSNKRCYLVLFTILVV